MSSPEDTSDGVWVCSDVAPDGTYIIGLHCGVDHAWTLTRDEALRHAAAVIAQAERAEYDAATVTLLHTKLGLPLDTAAEFLARNIRPDRPPISGPGPLAVAPGVSQRGGLHGFLTLLYDGEPIGQWELSDAHRYALSVLQVVAAVDNDAALYRALISSVGIDGARARVVVADIANHRDGPRE